jgi:hypothetical protein
MSQDNLHRDIRRLNSFLRGELSAVEMYSECIAGLSDPRVIDRLKALQASHEDRVCKLRDKILCLGGTPSSQGGLWAAHTLLSEIGGGEEMGTSTALSVLEAGEMEGLSAYQSDLSDLSKTTRKYVTNSLLPEQQRTHDQMAMMQHVI